MSNADRELLDRGIAALGLQLAEPACVTLMNYLELLRKWNRAFSLTAVTEPRQMVIQHLLDSLAVLPYLPDTGAGTRLVDVGSGTGLPGVVLAVARPHWQVSLAESRDKKVAFLNQARIELGIANITVQATRVESWRPEGGFSIVIARAFASLQRFVMLAGHLVASGGILAAMTGERPGNDDVAALPGGFRVESVHRLSVPFLDAERHLAICTRRVT